MTFIRKIKQRGKIYYAEVENQWIDGKCVQKHIRSLGTDFENPTNIAIEPTHFSYLSLRLLQGSLTPNNLFEMLENMGQPVKNENLKRLGIHYDFEKKRTPSPYLTRRTQNEKNLPSVDLTRTI
ncbi:MAG: hypothetical protein M8350_01200 [Methanosarcinaceae archaeon]|nr:hypothetical protein [Methanosarcinaceae archaeon]